MRLLKPNTVPLQCDKPGLSAEGIPSPTPRPIFFFFSFCLVSDEYGSNDDTIKEELTTSWNICKKKRLPSRSLQQAIFCPPVAFCHLR